MPSVEAPASVPEVSSKEAAKSAAVLDELFNSLSISKSADEAKSAASNIASLLNGPCDEQAVPAKYVLVLLFG